MGGNSMNWNLLTGYKNKYIVSTTGLIKNCITDKVLPVQDNRRGYKYVYLNSKHVYVHRVVATVFIPNPTNLPQVNHINGKKDDNRVENLEWCDGTYNQQHARLIGLPRKVGDRTGQKNGRYKDGMRCISNDVKVCPECNNKFSGKPKETVYCSKACSNKRNVRIMNERWKTQKQKN